MTRRLHLPLLLLLVIMTVLVGSVWGATPPASAATNTVWRDIPEPAISLVGNRQIIPVTYRTVELNVTALRATLPAGGFILYNGIFAFDETPSMTKGNLMAVKAGVALQGRPVRYAT